MARALATVRAARHGSGAVVLVSGPAGIGKTALLSEICQQAVAAKLRVARGKCDRIEQVWPGAPVIAALRAGRDPLAAAGEYERIVRLAHEPLLLVERIATTLETAAAATPLLVAIDDVRWADRISGFLLRTLVSRLVGLPVVWALAGCDADLVADLDAIVRTEHLDLAPLTTSDLVAIAQDRLGRVPDERIRRYLAAADGSPFLAGQIIDNLARAAARGEPDSVPAEFIAAVAHRLAELADAPRDVVRLVAVAGRPLPVGDLAAMLAVADVEHAVGRAIGSGLVMANGRALSFRHDLMREAVYATVPADLANELHRRFAARYLATEPIIAASHARAAVTPGDVTAATILVAAAEQLAGVSTEVAGELAALAFHTVRPSQVEWPELGLRCLAVLCRTQRTAEAIAAADLILARVDDADLVGEVETAAARALWLSGRIGELISRTDRVLRLGTSAPALAARMRSAHALAGTRLTTGPDAAREATAAVAEARATGDREALALALQAAGEAARNEAYHRASLAYFRELRSLTGAPCLAEEITALQFLDRYDHAQSLLDESRAGGSDTTVSMPPTLHCAQAWQDFYLGRLDDADAGGRTLIELGRQLGVVGVYTLDAIMVRVAVSLLRGDVEAAAAQLALADDLTDADADVRRPGLTVMHGWLAAAQGEFEKSLDTLGPVLSGAGTSRGYWPLWPCWLGLFFEFGTMAANTGFAAIVVEAAELAAARNPGVASFEGVALNVRGRAAGDLDTIARGADVLSRSPRPILRGFGADSHGRALLAAGHRTAGLSELDRAWDEYHRVDARTYRAGVQRVMRDAGARRGKWSTVATKPASGWPSLTESERRVAALIGAGRTNRSAAAELGVSVNTVGTHLRAVFAKLGIRSRVQLANVLHKETVS